MTAKTPSFLELHTRVYELGLLLRREGRTLFTEDDIQRKHRFHYNSDIPFGAHGFASLTEFLLFSDRRFKQVILDPCTDHEQSFISLLKENYMLKYSVPPNADNIPKLVRLDEEKDKPQEIPPVRLLKPKFKPPDKPPPEIADIKDEPQDVYPGETTSAPISSIHPPSAPGNHELLPPPIVIDDDPRPPSPPPIAIKQEIKYEIPPPRSPSPVPEEFGPILPPESPEEDQIGVAAEDPPRAAGLGFPNPSPFMELAPISIPPIAQKEPEPLVALNPGPNAAFIKKDISSTITMCLSKAEWVTVDEVRAAYSERYKPSFDDDCARIGCTSMEKLAETFQGEIDIYQNEFQQWICKMPQQLNSDRGRAEVKNFLYAFSSNDRPRRSSPRDEKSGNETRRSRRESPKRDNNQRYNIRRSRTRSRSPILWVHDKFEDKSPSPRKVREKRRRNDRTRRDEDRRRDRSPEMKRSPKASRSPKTSTSTVGPTRFNLTATSSLPSNKRLSPPRPGINGRWQHDKFEEDKNRPPRSPRQHNQHDDRVGTWKRRDSASRRNNDENKKKSKNEEAKKRDWSPPLDANGKWDKNAPREGDYRSNRKKYDWENGNLEPLNQNRRRSNGSLQGLSTPSDSSLLSRPNSRLEGEASSTTEIGRRADAIEPSDAENNKKRNWSPPLDANGKWDKSAPREADYWKKKYAWENGNLEPVNQNRRGSDASLQGRYTPIDFSSFIRPNSRLDGEASTSTESGKKSEAKEAGGKVKSKKEVPQWSVDPGIAAKEAFYKYFPKCNKKKGSKKDSTEKADDVHLWDEAVASNSRR